MTDDASETLQWLNHVDIEHPVGARIEAFVESHAVTDDVVPTLERFLSANDIDNRSAALAALVEAGKHYCYDADAILLHFQSRDGMGGSPEEFAALRYLRVMSAAGNAAARRALELLMADPYVQKLYGLS